MMIKMPQVLRARGYRLYTKDGKRLIDLWLNGGRALLGHTPPNVLRELKNTASRGLYSPYPHFTEGRFLKALAKLLPGYGFRIYNSRSTLRNGEHGDNFKVWRPFTNHDAPLLELVLPTPLSLCVLAAKSETELASLPPGETLPPLTLATAARGVYDLIAAPERARPQLPRTFKALREVNAEQNPACPWRREAIYLFRREPSGTHEILTEAEKEKWQELFNMFLEAGFLLPPTPEDPLILPGEMSDGEDALLAAKLAALLGGNK